MVNRFQYGFEATVNQFTTSITVPSLLFSPYTIIYSCSLAKTPVHSNQTKAPSAPCRAVRTLPPHRSGVPTKLIPIKLDDKFPPKTRTGMTTAVDTAWHKRGFDSLTCKC